MKTIILKYSFYLLFILITITNSNAQVGINTTDPKGAIDFNSSTSGVVYPNVALVATNDPSPVVNPQGGAIVPGTVVYNTNTTSTGAITDIYPGIYVWDGSQWIVHYKKRQSELYNQTTVLRPEANYILDWEDVPGLGIADLNTFTAKYTGLYRIEVKTYFGAGRTNSNSSSYAAMASGQFRLLFGGTPYVFETSAFSAYNSYLNAGTYYEDVWKESYETNYVTLSAGTTYPFSLCFDAYDAPGFINNGSTISGPTAVELINEDFSSYTVNQTSSSSGCGTGTSTNGWETSTSNPCSACTGRHLYINSDRSGCSQNSTALMSFTPTVASVDISFDYEFSERAGRADSFRVYLHNGITQVGADLVNIDNSGTVTTDTSYSGTATLVPGITHTLRFEYISSRAYYASVDNVLITELSGAPNPPSSLGLGYVGNDLKCQIEITYIGE